MRTYPEQIQIDGRAFSFEKVLKDDFFSVNVLYRNGDGVRYVLKLSDFRFLFGVLLRPLAAAFSQREYAIYRRVADIEGIPALGPRFGRRGYLHRYVEGRSLHELRKGEALPDDFFPRLGRIIAELHRRRVFYLDLNKRGNVILGDDGRPYLIDFQVSVFLKKRKGPGGRLTDRLFNLLIQEDLYHLYKHKRHFQRHLMTPDELRLARKTRFNEALDRFLGTPYRRVKRLLYPSGSNETVWYKWRKLKDQSKRMP